MNNAEKLEKTPEEEAGFKGFRLEDLVRTKSTVSIFTDEVDSEERVEYTLRPVGLADEVWMKNKWGEDLQTIFKEINVGELSKLIYHQMTDADKAKLPGLKEKKPDDDGFEVEVITPAWKRIQNGIRGIPHQLEVYQALLCLIGLSRPVIDKLTKEEEKEVEKKSDVVDVTIPTGAKSSTESQVSTDGPLKKSPE